ncbi:MAG: hypothetical protein DI570_13750 [Phenylobacterium zucineum]|nr:MAG: hypothetical protein DI570_13750 [Phenylobacterium zucineum]
MTSESEAFTPETAPGDGELVHWMAPGRLQVGASGVAAAFALGAALAVGAYLAFRWAAPRREGLPPWKWARGPVH